MFIMTEAAGARLAQKLVAKEVDAAMRFVRDDDRGGWSVRVDKPVASDTAFSHDGRKVLVLDEQAAHRLRDQVLDVKETDEGTRLRLYRR